MDRDVLEADNGRRELLSRKMFHLRRFDSAEYFQTGDKNKFLKELDKTEDYEKKHHLNHKHFEHHAGDSPRTQNEHPLQHEIRTESDEKGVSRKSFVNKRGNEQEITRRSFTRKRPTSKDHVSDKNTTPAHLAANDGSLPENRSAIMAQRFLKKRGQRKRWDSADYNALLDQGASFDSDTKPDLDVMSVSSGEGTESKADDSLSVEGQNKKGLTHRSKSSLRLLSGLPPTGPSQNRKNEMATEDGETLQLPNAAARQHFLHNQKRQTRFDSADYFRGISPPSQELNSDPWDESPVTPRTKLGKSTLAQRELRAEKLRKERDAEIL